MALPISKKSKLLAELRHTLSSFEELSFVYLFGSAVRREDFRDIDLAVYLKNSDEKHPQLSTYERFKLAMKIGRIIERKLSERHEVDVRILNEAPPFFNYEVLKTGRLVFQNDYKKRVRYEGNLLSIYLDYRPVWTFFLDRYLKKGNNNMEREPEIFQHLQEMDEALADWKRYQKDVTEEKIRTERDTRNMVMHAMLISIQSCIDIANHLIIQQNFPRPATYRETFEILTEKSVISEELGEALADLAGFRNVLVHIYWRLDLKRVYEILQNELEPLRQFRNKACKLLATWSEKEKESWQPCPLSENL